MTAASISSLFFLLMLAIAAVGMVVFLFMSYIPKDMWADVTGEQMIDLGIATSFTLLNMLNLLHLLRHKIVKVPLQAPLLP